MNKRTNGLQIWAGPSVLTGEPIKLVLTGLTRRSENAKTGNTVQSWILPDVAGIKVEPSKAICGNCPHGEHGSCYVTWHKAPTTVQRTTYPVHPTKPQMVTLTGTVGLSESQDPTLRTGTQRASINNFDVPDIPALHGRVLRIGSAGDPAAVPASIWRQLISMARDHVGYTHQWRELGKPLRGQVMASVDSPAERALAKMNGWRTFRVRPQGAPLLPKEVDCPAVTHGRTCEQCRLCTGSKADISIEVHGSAAKIAAFDNLLVEQISPRKAS